MPILAWPVNADPEMRRLPAQVAGICRSWRGRYMPITDRQYWSELMPFVGEAESLAAWLGPSVSRWHQHWVVRPLPHVELPRLPSGVR